VEIPIGIGSRPRHRRGAKLTRLLLDTTFLIDAERTGDELDEVIDDDDDAAIAAITVAELRVGVELSRGKARSSRHEFLNDVLASIPLLEYNLGVAEAHAQLLLAVRRQGRPRGAHDLVIAATALASQRTVLTADFTAFDDLPGVNVHLHR
jgi:tRNA(fMet)-specific endonuclease VapC